MSGIGCKPLVFTQGNPIVNRERTNRKFWRWWAIISRSSPLPNATKVQIILSFLDDEEQNFVTGFDQILRVSYAFQREVVDLRVFRIVRVNLSKFCLRKSA